MDRVGTVCKPLLGEKPCDACPLGADLFGLAYSPVSSRHTRDSLSKGWTAFHYLYTSGSFRSLTSGHLGHFHLLVIADNAVMNMRMFRSFVVLFSNYLG